MVKAEFLMSAAPPPRPAEPHAADNSWYLWASGFVGGFVLISLILALIVLPPRSESKFDPLTAICRALGIPGYEKVPPDPGAARASAPVSNVAWTVETRRLLSDASATSGAVLAKGTCGACHGVDGKSVDPTQFPDLARQSAAAIFKQLNDFQSGDRKSAIMQPVAQLLTNEQMADVASYYATRPSVDVRVADSGVSPNISTLAREGDPRRAIPPCDSCHGPSRSGPEEAPLLLGQSTSYLETQLKNFGTDERHNDFFQRMRIIAHELTPEEERGLAIYYHGMPPLKWLSSVAPWEIYLIAAPCIMLGAILFFRGIILLLESPKRERQ
jgi:cytochrome c553